MKIIRTNKKLLQWQQGYSKKSIGFIPTMGALHKGHLSLIKTAKKECAKVVVSIFVNKLQFGPQEDFKKYPRLIDIDIELLKNEKIDVLFLPTEKEMYPKKITIKVQENNISKKLEGLVRPNFFSGVLTIVLKLFNLVQPTHAYFGEKDIQQLYIIKKMIEDLNLSILIRGCPTIREKNGLAMSSRNQYLSSLEKAEAAILYNTLEMGKNLIIKKMQIKKIKIKMQQILQKNNITIDYISITDLKNFEELTNCDIRPIVISGAIWYNNVRLIDNIILKH